MAVEVSIIIPAYNAAPWLAGTIESCLCQQAGARHMLLGHLAVPVVMVALATLPLAWLLSRARDRSPRRT